MTSGQKKKNIVLCLVQILKVGAFDWKAKVRFSGRSVEGSKGKVKFVRGEMEEREGWRGFIDSPCGWMWTNEPTVVPLPRL